MFFRVCESRAPYATFPIEPELLKFICYLNRGLIRRFLEQLHNSLDFGPNNGHPEITFKYAEEHPLEILGKELDRRAFENFCKLKYNYYEDSSNKGIGRLIKDLSSQK